jgi:TPR repeat protein
MMRKIRTIAVAAVITALAGSLPGCVSEFNRLQKQADIGDHNSQAELGMAYIIGGITPIDYEMATVWLKLAAQLSNPVAIYFNGYLQEKGWGDQTPNPTMARILYERSFAILSRSNLAGQFPRMYVLGLQHYYARGTEKDTARALRLFLACYKEKYLPAAVELGKMYYHGDGVERDLGQARSYFYHAAENNYPEAQYYLARIYFSEKSEYAGNKELNYAVEMNYPPAQFEMAERIERSLGRVDEKARKLYFLAADNGQARAQFKVSQLLASDPHIAGGYLLKAVERSYPPAMLELAQQFNSGKDQEPVKSLILYELAGKLNTPGVQSPIELIDARTGMYLPVRFTWYGQNSGADFIITETPIRRAITGYLAGIREGSRTTFEDELQRSYKGFYMGLDWFPMHEFRMPPSWISLIFKAAHKYEQDQPGFWLSYGICAVQAGQGETVMYAAAKMRETVTKIGNAADARLFLELANLTKTAGLVMIGQEDEAYNSLYIEGRLQNAANPHLINCLNKWFRPALKNPNKFAVATGIQENLLGSYMSYPRMPFYDFELGQEITDRIMVEQPPVTAK